MRKKTPKIIEKCLKCGKKLKNFPHKRKKSFCNSTCRSGLWQINNRKMLKEAGNVKEPDLAKSTK